MTQPALPTPRFDTFYRYDELTRLLFAYAEAYPTLVAVRSIGKSHEGRDIWVATVTNIATGAAADKPAFWADGNIHAAELTASTTVLYYLNTLVTQYGSDADVTALLDSRAIYLCPRLNPDGAELALADRPRHIRSSTRPYPFDEEPVEGLTREDIDGDGRVLFMRIADPHGTYKKCEADPRLMVAREPGEFGGEYYRLMPEGFVQQLRRPDGQGELRRRGPGPEPQLPVVLAPGVRAGRRRRLPDQRAGSEGDGRLHRQASQHRRGDQLSHAQRRDPAAHGHAERRGHDSRGPVVDQALQRDRRQAHGLSGDQHLARLQVPPQGSDLRHAGLGLRASRRAVLGGGDLVAEQGSRASPTTSGSTGIASTRSRTTSSSSSGATSIAAARRTSSGSRSCIRSSARWRSAAGTR